jgi:hypothetical protein
MRSIHATGHHFNKEEVPIHSACYTEAMRIAVAIIGALALAMGLLWIGQGMGWILWPKSSFMLNQPKWSWYGTVLAIAGMASLWIARR